MEYGASLALLGDARCERVLRGSLEEMAGLYGAQSGKTGKARIYLGVCLRATTDVVEAGELLREGRRDFVREFGKDHEVVRMADDLLSGRGKSVR